MQHFPVFLDLSAADIVILGGGELACQKYRLLAKTSAHVILIAGELNDELADLAINNDIEWHKKDLSVEALVDTDFEGAGLIYAADVSEACALQAVELAHELNIPINVVDRPDLCSFLTPSIIDRDPVTIAIGTQGSAPVLARTIKSKIEALLPARIGALAKHASGLRTRVKSAIGTAEQRRLFWEKFFAGPPARLYLARNMPAFDKAVDEALDQVSQLDDGSVGCVSLVGAGPGDPDLLTLKAQRCLQEADVIVYDRLIGPHILDYARRDALRIPVGKTPGQDSISQAEINRILTREALAGKCVIRLKGGDPFIFGRGGEELAVLDAMGIAVEIVPGITAAAGCAASIRLPLTVRGQNRSITLITGMTGDGKAEHDWAALAAPGAACALYMGVRTAGHIQQRLLQAKIDPETPVVIVENGTLDTENVVISKIALLEQALEQHDLNGPAIIFIGLVPNDALMARDDIEKHLEDNTQNDVLAFPGAFSVGEKS